MKMKSGKMLNLSSGDVILALMQFTDSLKIKIRPAVILYEEFDNLIIAGITSNLRMVGIPLTVKEGAIKPSIIKLNYIFTISKILVKRKLFSLKPNKKQQIFDELVKKISQLREWIKIHLAGVLWKEFFQRNGGHKRAWNKFVNNISHFRFFPRQFLPSRGEQFP